MNRILKKKFKVSATSKMFTSRSQGSQAAGADDSVASWETGDSGDDEFVAVAAEVADTPALFAWPS
jgi:hypothetical protein